MKRKAVFRLNRLIVRRMAKTTVSIVEAAKDHVLSRL